MPVQLVPLTSIPDIAFTYALEKDAIKDADRMRRETTEVYAIARNSGEAICVIGVRPYTFCSIDATLWAVWFEESQPLISEFREGKRLMNEWLAGQVGRYFLEVRSNFPIGQRFAKWLGFTEIGEQSGFKLYMWD